MYSRRQNKRYVKVYIIFQLFYKRYQKENGSNKAFPVVKYRQRNYSPGEKTPNIT